MLAFHHEEVAYSKKKRWIRLFFTAFLVFLMLVFRNSSWSGKAEYFIHQNIYNPMVAVIRPPFLWVEKKYMMFNTRSQTLSDIKALQNENNKLKAKVRILNYYQKENVRLKKLMESTSELPVPGRIAEITSTQVEGYREEIVINKGSADGVFKNQALVDPFGLVGQIIKIYPHQAVAILITDGRSRVPVYVKRTGQRALVLGSTGKYRLELPSIGLNADIKVGDELLSSGLGDVYPRGYPVARVANIARDPKKEFMQIYLEAEAHLNSMLEVLLIDRQDADESQDTYFIPVGPPARLKIPEES